MEVFITGTDTGVGKTIVTTGLALALQKQNQSVSILKAVETGCDPTPEDANFYKTILKLEDDLNSICPMQFKHPLAPSVASEIEKKEISLIKIINTFHSQKEKYQHYLVEGAGGLLVPVLDGFTMADLSLILNLPIIIVVGNKLGALNHALLSYHFAQAKGLKVLSLLVNPLDNEPGLAEKTNTAELKKYIMDCPIVECPYIDNITDEKNYQGFEDISKRIFNL